MNSGISGSVVLGDYWLTKAFNVVRGAVVKKYHIPSEQNPDSLEDYQNEVAVLEVLDRHRKQLSFSVPKILRHGTYTNPEKAGAAAYLKMTVIRDPLSRFDLNTMSPLSWEDHAKHAGKVLAELHSIKLSDSEKETLVRAPIRPHLKKQMQNNDNEEYTQYYKYVSALFDQLEGAKVLIHGDFALRNLFGLNPIRPITGMCDFCYSGLEVKEFDFLPILAKGDQVWDVFRTSYVGNGGDFPSAKNVAVMKLLNSLWNKMGNDRVLEDAIADCERFVSFQVMPNLRSGALRIPK